MAVINPNLLRRKEGEKEKRRKEILHRARGLFTKLGYHETTIEKIAQDANLGKGTVYYYYANKEEILSDILIEQIRTQKRKILRDLEYARTFRQVTRTIANSALTFLTEHLEHLHTFQTEQDKLRTKCPAFLGRLMKEMVSTKKLFIRLVGRFMKSEGIAEDPEIIYDLISSQIIGYAHHFYKLKTKKEVLIAKLETSLDIIHRGLTMVSASRNVDSHAFAI